MTKNILIINQFVMDLAVLTLDLVLDLVPGSVSGPVSGMLPDWSSETGLKNPKLRYTGLEGLYLPSNNLRLLGPRIG